MPRSIGPMVTRRLSRPGPWAILATAFVAYAAVFVAWALAPIDVPDATRSFIGDVAFLPAGLVVALLAFHASRFAGLSSRAATAWRWLALAYLLYWAGDTILALYDQVLGEIPYPSIADAAYLAFYPALLIGLVAFPRVIPGRQQALKFVLDAATVALGGSIIVWYFLLGPIAAADHADLSDAILSLAYPVGDVVLLLGLAANIIRAPREVPRRALLLLVAGLVVTLAADIGYGVQNLDGIYVSGQWVDALYMAAWGLLGASAWFGHGIGSAEGRPRWLPEEEAPLAPYLAVALGYGMLVAGIRAAWSPTLAGLVVGAGLLTGLVVIRQAVAMEEHRRRLRVERQARRSETRQLTQQALYDGLTGLANRIQFGEQLAAALSASRVMGKPSAVLFLDLDDLKKVNDSLGHEAGDHMLVELAARLQGAVRATDLAARLAGDEFALLLRPPTSQAAAVALSERILASLRAPFEIDGSDVPLTASIGVAVSQEGEEAAAELLDQADSAMYAAKSAGKNRYAMFAPGMQAPLQGRLGVASALRRALDAGEFQLLYQPIVELTTGRFVGAEALLRWHRPGLGVVPPANFLPIAEREGLIVPIGAWALAEACRTAATWPRLPRTSLPGTRPTAPSRPSISVNLSAAQLRDPGLEAAVTRSLAETNLAPERLTLEVRARDLGLPNEALQRLAALRALGIRLTIDDFGTADLPLSEVRAWPVDELKIDRSLVASLDRVTGASLVHGIVALGHSLELAVVGEGVERLDQAEALAGLRCDLGQGFLYGRPMAAADLPLVQTEPALNPPIRVRAQSALPAPVAPGDA